MDAMTPDQYKAFCDKLDKERAANRQRRTSFGRAVPSRLDPADPYAAMCLAADQARAKKRRINRRVAKERAERSAARKLAKDQPKVPKQRLRVSTVTDPIYVLQAVHANGDNWQKGEGGKVFNPKLMHKCVKRGLLYHRYHGEHRFWLTQGGEQALKHAGLWG